MKALVYDAPRKYEYREIPDPELEPDEILMKIQACGLCGTDLHIHEGEFAPRFPLVPGHEFTGTVAATGSAVTGLSTEERVVANSNMACGHCFYCVRGDRLLCENLEAYGVTRNGGFAEYMKIKAHRVFPISRLSPREAVMVEPSSCALHGMEVLNMEPGSDVLIFGAGPTGQVLAQLLKVNGAATLTAAAPAGPKLDLIGRLAADHTVAIDRKDPELHRRRLREIAPKGFDYVIEATGAPAVCEEAINFVRRRGTILVYGVYPEKASVRFDPFDVFRREITIKGSFAQIDSFQRALNYLENGRIQVKEIVTQEIPLKDWGQALDLAWKRQGIKTALVP